MHARCVFRDSRLTSAATSLQSLFRGVYVICFAISFMLTSIFLVSSDEAFVMMSIWLSIFNHVCVVDLPARN